MSKQKYDEQQQSTSAAADVMWRYTPLKGFSLWGALTAYGIWSYGTNDTAAALCLLGFTLAWGWAVSD